MVQITKIISALSDLVGWASDNSYDTGNITIDESLTKSTSGLYFQQAHPLITIKNLLSIAPVDILDIKDETAKNKAFSDWLRKKTEASISKAIIQFCNNKVVNMVSAPILENKILFDGTGRITDTINNTDNLVGFEIVPIRAKGIVTQIIKIGLQFTEPGTYTLYLMKSGKTEPVKTIPLERKTKGTVEWFEVDDILLPYLDTQGEAGGSWYLVYKQSELPEGSKAINKDYDWSKGPCTICSRINLALYKAWSKYIEIHPFKATAPDSLTLWDVSNNLYTYNKNYGLNLELTVACDLTDFIVAQKDLFKELIWYQVAVDMLRELAYNPNGRINRTSMMTSKAEILYELDGDSSSNKTTGLVYKLDKAYKAIDLSTQGLDRVCLKCKGSGIKYRSI